MYLFLQVDRPFQQDVQSLKPKKVKIDCRDFSGGYVRSVIALYKPLTNFTGIYLYSSRIKYRFHGF